MRAVIYARYSSSGQREESIEGQLRECNEYAARHGITIVTTFIDRAVSAKTDNRPEFQRMISESAKKQFNIVLVWKLDRFSRDRGDSAMYRAVLRRNGVKVVSAKENIVFVSLLIFRFKKLPLVVLMGIHFTIVMGFAALYVWISGFFIELHPRAMLYMIRSVLMIYPGIAIGCIVLDLILKAQRKRKQRTN